VLKKEITKTIRLVASGFMVLALTIGSFSSANAGSKLDKKLKKKAQKAVGALASLPATADSSEAVIGQATEIIGEVGQVNSAAAADFLLKIALVPLNCPAAEVAMFEATKAALGSMDDKGARKSIYKAIKKKRDWRIQITLIEVIKNFNDDESQFMLQEMLAARRIDERVVAEVVRTLAHRKDKRGVRPIIKIFDRYRKGGGVTFEAIKKALNDLTGKSFPEQQDWESFWDPREQTFDPETVVKEPIGGTILRKGPKLFGSEVVSKKVVIIIDCSGSMAIKDPGEDKDEDAEEIEEGDGSKVRKKKKKKKVKPATPPYTGPALQPNDPNYNKLPKERMRIERAKKQLRRLVNAFGKDARFNIVKFSTAASSWKPKKIMPASPGNKADALKFIAALKASGVTQAYKSLVEAFSCQEADTIYFISDGAPTTDQGTILDAKGIQNVMDKIKQMNKFRKVKINTIGLKGSSPQFMRQIAQLTGGKYKQVD
jgi:hypothetical protein